MFRTEQSPTAGVTLALQRAAVSLPRKGQTPRRWELHNVHVAIGFVLFLGDAFRGKIRFLTVELVKVVTTRQDSNVLIAGFYPGLKISENIVCANIANIIYGFSKYLFWSD
jgi:hypothetical protein